MSGSAGPRRPDLEFVVELADRLEEAGLRAWLCGGWAEELRGLTPPRPHADVDLLYPGPDFGRVDRFIEEASVEEWLGKRRHHKRAFAVDGVLVELILVEHDPTGWFTALPGGVHRWPHDVFATSGRLRVASVDALTGFREAIAARRARAA
jgi:hypothetical protein